MKSIGKGFQILMALMMAAVFALGCSTVNEEKPGDPRALEEAARALHTNMRWARWEHASDLIHEAYKQEFLGRYEELGDDFRIVDMEFKSAEIVEDGFSAVLEVDQEWYQLPETTIRSERFMERWVFEEGVWRLRERVTREEYRAMGRVFESEALEKERREREEEQERLAKEAEEQL